MGQGPRAALGSDVGMVRERNEDAAHVDARERYFVLADGMGGHRGGDIASATAVDAVRTILDDAAGELDAFEAAPSPRGRRRIRDLMVRAVKDANDRIRERARVEPAFADMGTTLEVVVIAARELFVAHVGDSRTYLIRDGHAVQLTTDHTAAEVMRMHGMMSPDEAASSPLRSLLTNAVGLRPELAIEHRHLALEDGDRVLVCSDGLYEYFTAAELRHAVTEHPAEDAIADLIAGARSRGGHDNITGIVVDVPPRAPAREAIREYSGIAPTPSVIV
jgi:serine/threonine protein phosphatase PrpC